MTASRWIAALERQGFQRIRQSGSHFQLKRGNLLVVVPVHRGDLGAGVLKSILRQAHWSVEGLIAAL
jgi:predicted RNA binding protein YcfA (HicA-like mRNA interferase family)